MKHSMSTRTLRLAVASLSLTFGVLFPAAAATPTVDLALVMAVDVSLSVDDDEYLLQHEGIARAFENPALFQSVADGKNHAIEVAVIEWSDRDKQIVTVDWTRVDSAESAAAFAAKVRATRRSSNGLTAIGDALLAAQALLNRAPAPAERRMVDVSGDGMANIGADVPTVRDELIAAGITINGLAIISDEPWVDSYYNEDVVGGPGAFLLEAQNFQSFAAAMQEKLLSEVAGLAPNPRTATVQTAAARSAIPPSAAQMQ